MKKFTFFTMFFTAFLFFGIQNVSFGQLLLDENFSYPAGSLITANGWTAHSGGGTQPITVSSGGLTYTGYVDSGIGNAALADNTGEDDNKTFAPQASGSVYVSFMVNVTTVSAGYFFHIGPSPIGSTFRGRVYMDATSHFGVGVGSAAGTYASSTFTVGTTYLLVLKYENVTGATNDKVSLFIFNSGMPATEPGAPTIGPLVDATQADIIPGAVALRQYSATQNITVDGIRVGTSWSDIYANVVLPVPTNYPTNFAATTAPFTINLNWTDAVGGQLPGSYLILASATNDIVAPVDGVPVVNNTNLASGTGALNVSQGVQAATFTNLPSNTPYYFKIFPYTNNGSDIKYKTDGTPPFVTATTTDHILVLAKNFDDQLFDPWDTISVLGGPLSKNWQIQGSGGSYYAYINGYQTNCDDWLISPSMNFDATQEEILTFLTASNFTGPLLEVKISTDYVTGADPATGTWTPLTATLSPGSYVWTASGNVDVSGFNGGNVHVAYRYTATTTLARAWEVDNIMITGRPSNVATVTTDPAVTNITHLAATAGGTVVNAGGAAILARGICYSTNPNPTITDPHTTVTGTLGHFTSSLTGLTPNTAYYVRAYATTSNGNGYGDVVPFTTLCDPLPPVVNFIGDTLTIFMGESVDFFDASLYCPTYWKWSFVGGSPYESYDKNPADIVYNLPGLFTVCLDASNAFGFASSCKEAYIRVLGPTNAKITMTEIMYNPPELGTDTLEFIELYNNDVIAWNLKDFYFEQGVTFVFPDISVNPGAYLLVAKNAAAMQHAFGVTALQWTDGSLNNTGEPIVINDNYGYLVDSVFYGVTPPWDTLANGFGSSLELCNPNSDNTDPLNWRHAIEFQTVNASGDTIWASPLAGCSYAPVAVFSANKTIIVEHEFVTFTDASTINTADWEWTFEGGTPATYSGKTPPPIQYNTMGLYDVSLRVSNNAGHNTMVKSNYINVGTTGISGMDATGFSVYPNPNSGTFKVILKNSNPVQFRIFNQLSNLVLERKSELQVNLFEKSELAPGIYMLQVTDLTTQQSHTQKLVIQ